MAGDHEGVSDDWTERRVLRSDLGRRVVRHVDPAVEIPIHFVESEMELVNENWTFY